MITDDLTKVCYSAISDYVVVTVLLKKEGFYIVAQQCYAK